MSNESQHWVPKFGGNTTGVTILASELDGKRQEILIEAVWAAAGSKDTELGVKMEPEVGHGATEIYPRVQA